MIIDCISDLHGHYPKLEGGDLLILAGDLTAKDTQEEYRIFDDWIYEQNYTHKIVIAGNHDNKLMCDDPFLDGYLGIHPEYLCDSGTEFEGLKIWGSPWTKWFPEVNPKCTAFMLKTEEELAEKWAMIPVDTDILVTHSPPYGILDTTVRRERVGSKSLQMKQYKDLSKLKLWVMGHIHESYGIDPPGRIEGCQIVNASHVNERYEPVNKPIRIILYESYAM